MTKRERNNWIVNIENTAAAIESQLGSAVVESVFKRYGAHGTWDLNPSDLPECSPSGTAPTDHRWLNGA